MVCFLKKSYLGLPKVSELVKGREGILPLNFATNIQMAVLPKVRSALCAASQLPGEGPTDMENAPAP